MRPYFNDLDVVRHPHNVWVIDFGVGLAEGEASFYEKPFEYVRRVVKPIRDTSATPQQRDAWWLHRRPAPDMRDAVTNLPRFIVTPKIVKHRLFTWVNSQIISDCQLYCVARADDYFFGVLHSRAHELWALRMGTSLEYRPRYTPTTTFETFLFPWPPGQEPKDDPKVKAIAEAARAPAQKRDAWLNPAGATAAELVGRPAQDARRRCAGGLRLACLADG